MSNLNLLIEHYEAERDYLKSEMELCKKNAFFIEAQYYFDTLIRINGHLNHLYRLKDPSHNDKKLLKRQISYLQRYFEKNPRITYKKEELEMMKKNLSTLEEASKQHSFFEDADTLDEALEQLWVSINKRLLFFVFNDEKGIYWQFSRTLSNTIKITCSSEMCRYIEKNHPKITIPKLKNIGFRKTSNYWYIEFELVKSEDTQYIKGILGQFIFEILRPMNIISSSCFLKWEE